MNMPRYAPRALGAGLLVLFPLFSMLPFLKARSAADGVLALLGGGLAGPGSDFLRLLLTLFPTLLLFYLLIDFMQVDFAADCAYVFTRSGRRSRWLASKAAGLLAWIVVFVIWEYLLLLALDLTNGIPAAFPGTARVFLCALLLDALSSFLFLFPMCLAAIRLGTVIPYVLGITLYALLLGAILAPQTARWLPVAQGFLAWHDTP